MEMNLSKYSKLFLSYVMYYRHYGKTKNLLKEKFDSKEKIEDEYIAKTRLESLVWATYLNYCILLLALLFVYDMAFFWVMIFNMFTLLLFFIVRFNYLIFKLNKTESHEE